MKGSLFHPDDQGQAFRLLPPSVTNPSGSAPDEAWRSETGRPLADGVRGLHSRPKVGCEASAVVGSGGRYPAWLRRPAVPSFDRFAPMSRPGARDPDLKESCDEPDDDGGSSPLCKSENAPRSPLARPSSLGCAR